VVGAPGVAGGELGAAVGGVLAPCPGAPNVPDPPGAVLARLVGVLPGALPDPLELETFVNSVPARDATLITSFATDFPAAATPLNTVAALLRRLIVSEIALADTRPARSVSSTPSVNFVKKFPAGAWRSAYLDSRNST
jgi:hypothetical protein